MSTLTPPEKLLAQRLIAALNLESVDLLTVDPHAPLFGQSVGGWGLDSIDALEIALAIQQHYGVEIRSEDQAVKQAFSSLRALNAHIASRQ